MQGDLWQGAKQRLVLPDGRVLAYVDTQGEGRPWMLIHGYSDTSRSYMPLLPHLAGRRLLIPDLPGHGGSTAAGRASLRDIGRDLRHLAAHAGAAPELVVGHSMGSLLALDIASRGIFADLKVVLLAGTPWPASTGLAFLDAVDDLPDPPDVEAPFFDSWYESPVPLDPQFVASVRQEAAAMPRQSWMAYRVLIATTDLRSRLRRVAAPVLALSGACDPIFPLAHAALLEAGLARGEVIRLEGHGHNPHWEDPARMASLMTVFAARAR